MNLIRLRAVANYRCTVVIDIIDIIVIHNSVSLLFPNPLLENGRQTPIQGISCSFIPQRERAMKHLSFEIVKHQGVVNSGQENPSISNVLFSKKLDRVVLGGTIMSDISVADY